jgi:hypothetical protein
MFATTVLASALFLAAPDAPAAAAPDLRPVPVSHTHAEGFARIAGLWRLAEDDRCDGDGEYQFFSMTAEGPMVEVGAGNPGSGLRLPIVAFALDDAGTVALATRVCGPPGCSRTEEVWRLGADGALSEWAFTGLDGDQPPYVQMVAGRYLDGSPGRTFVRCRPALRTRSTADVAN